MKKLLPGILVLSMLLLAMLLPQTAAAICADGDHFYTGFYVVGKEPTCTEYGVKYPECFKCGFVDESRPVIIEKAGHKYDAGTVVREGTCTEPGIIRYTCKECGATMDKETGTAKNHSFGEWTVTKKATCTETGEKTRICSGCGKEETESIPKADHDWQTVDTSQYYEEDSNIDRWIRSGQMQDGYVYRVCRNCGRIEKTGASAHRHTWGDWKVTKKATCKANGTQTRTCTGCGKEETESIPKSSAHKFGDWEVTKEATCTKDGKEKCYCTVCGASKTRIISKLGHSYGEFEIIVEATDCSKGRRASKCERCGKSIDEEFYPEGTLYKGGDNPPEDVRALQTALAELGLYKGKIVTEYGNGTASAVSKFEKEYLGMKGDGIAWPKVIRALGLKRGEKEDGTGEEWDGIPVSSDTSKVKLLLGAEMLSPRGGHSAGERITIQWTLTNQTDKNEASSVRVSQFRGMKADKKKDTEIARPETLAPGESRSGTFEYIVTPEDEAAGRFTIGFIARGKIRKKDENSNSVWFNFQAGPEMPEVIPIDLTQASDSGDPDETEGSSPDGGIPEEEGETPADGNGTPKSGTGTQQEGKTGSPDGGKQGAGAAQPAPAGAACGDLITAADGGIIEYEIILCAKHAGIVAETKRRMDNQGYEQAKDLLDTAIDELYTEWIGRADAESIRNIVDDQAAFMFRMKSLEAVVRMICPAEEAGRILLEERMNQCVRLCRDLHTAPETRPGSMPAGYAVRPDSEAGKACTHLVTEQTDGSVHISDVLCGNHQQTMQTISRLLENAAGGEEKVIVWQRAQDNWMLELNNMYDIWYLSAEESQRGTITADRVSFDQMIEARRKTLADLYPDDPAAAEEALARQIMERAQLVCRLLHAAGVLKD